VLDERHFPGRQGRLLFAYLVAKHGKLVPRDELAEALWEGVPPASWDKALRVLVSKLRTVLAETEDGATADLTASSGCYRLDLPAGTWIDVLAAESAAQEAEGLLATDELEGAIRAASVTESVLHQPFMPGDDGTWVHGKRRELDEIRLRALSVLAEACLRSGQAEAAVRWAEQAVKAEQFRESGYRRLMAAHIAAGNRAEALRVYERCRLLLAEELGAYPSPETDAIYRRLLDEPPGDGDATTRHSGHPFVAGPGVRDGSVTQGTSNGAGTSGRRARSTRLKLAALAASALVVAGAIAAAIALVGRGGSAPAVLPNSVIRIDPRTLEVTQVVPVADAPDLVIVSGGYLWITNHILRQGTDEGGSGAPRNAGDHTLTRVDPSTGKAVVVGGGLAPCGLTADPSGDVWVANCYPSTIPGRRDDVVRVDARTLAFEKTLPAPGGDGFFRGLAYGGGSLWLSQIVGGDVQNPDTVTQIDAQTGKARAIHFTREASGLAWSGGYGDLWINNFYDASLTRLHPATGAIETIDEVANQPAFPVVDGNVVWAADWAAPQVVRLSAVGSPRPHRIALPGGTTGVWVIAVGAGAVWATTPRDGVLWRIDPETNRVTRVNLPYLPTGVTAGANDVWVTVRGP
jgi:DNA-binding SARP family transcriptional activator/streptogramin lyase